MPGRISAECFICGLDFYQDEMTRHYKYNRLVDTKCADELNHDDYMMFLRLPEERRKYSEQPVSYQGEQPQPDDGWYTAKWYQSKWRA